MSTKKIKTTEGATPNSGNPSLALYRKYRPQLFDDVVGQSHIVQTLKNQIKHGTLGHAYLFCGSRGTGKTSVAKIFAKAVNCTDQAHAPCGKCEVCQGLATSTNLDILEVDAASNNGVDEIRILRDNIQFLPSVGKYKVYIIDEVHMLSNSAFNALLKTLEEPPSHAIFVLATTEVHKLPATILSRCLRFDFRLVDKNVLKEHLLKVCKLENITIDDAAADYIAMRAEGSVRDCLSIANSCIAVDGLKYDSVLKSLGATDKQHLVDFLYALDSADISKVLKGVQQLSLKSVNWSQIAKEVCASAKDVLTCIAVGTKGMHESAEYLNMLEQAKTKLNSTFLISVMHNYASCDQDFRNSSNPRLTFETVSLVAATRAGLDLAALQERISRLEEFVKANSMHNAQFTMHNEGGNLSANVGMFQANNNVGSTQIQNERRVSSVGVSQPSVDASQIQNSEFRIQNSGGNINSSAVSSNNVGAGQGSSSSGVSVGGVNSGHGAVASIVSTFKESPKPRDAMSVWGKVASWMRTNSTTSNFNLIATHTRVSINDNVLVVSISDAKIKDFEAIRDIIKNAMTSLGFGLELNLARATTPKTKDSEINRIKGMIGETPVNIKK